VKATNFEDFGKFVRWQGRTIEHLGFFNNLLITLTFAQLAFQAHLILEPLAQSNTILNHQCLFQLSLISAWLSLVFGLWLAFNRLYDFRYTAKIARLSEKNEVVDPKLREATAKLGKKTWGLLWLQCLTFFFGMTFFALLVLKELQ
jgi:hypothetical protein